MKKILNERFEKIGSSAVTQLGFQTSHWTILKVECQGNDENQCQNNECAQNHLMQRYG